MQLKKLEPTRRTVFISKATPEDDEFVLWLAPRLEAAGYEVFADILTLEPGDRWRREVTGTLQNNSIKMLLLSGFHAGQAWCARRDWNCRRPSQRTQRSAIYRPTATEKFKKLFGIGELQFIDFLGSWANGLRDLLDTLDKEGILRSSDKVVINPNWEAYKKRLAIQVEEAPEVLTSNWLRIKEVPDVIRYYQPSGAIDHDLMGAACRTSDIPAEVYLRGFFSFALPDEIGADFAHVGKFIVRSEHPLLELLEMQYFSGYLSE